MMEYLKVIELVMVFHILHWNARSLISNGQEFKKVVSDMEVRPDVMCIQETWLRPQLDFVIPGYNSVRCDRIGKQGGGCVTFIKENLAHRRVTVPNEYECVVVEMYSPRGNIKVVNFYNPCKKLSMQTFHKISESVDSREIWCGDFNAHNTLWGSDHTDNNGEVVEEFIEERSLYCLNDGRGTRVDVIRNSVSCLDLTLVNMSNICEWDIKNDTNIGSDHFPIICSMDFDMYIQEGYVIERWCFPKANWEKFKELCIEYTERISMEGDVNSCAAAVTSMIISAATTCIPKSTVNEKKKIVPWWNDECKNAIKNRNNAFRILRKHLSQDNLVDYQRKRAMARKIIKASKKNAWRQFCSSIGREVNLSDIWAMIKKMSGKRKTIKIPVLIEGKHLANYK